MYISPANKVHILVCFSWCKDTPWTTHGQVHGLGVFLVDIKGDSDAVFCDADFRLARQRQEISRCQIGKISFHRTRKRSDIFLRDLETASVARKIDLSWLPYCRLLFAQKTRGDALERRDGTAENAMGRCARKSLCPCRMRFDEVAGIRRAGQTIDDRQRLFRIQEKQTCGIDTRCCVSV